MKRAFLFPGQGSQKVGMVHDLYTRYDAVKKLIGEADERLGFSISKLMFEGPDAELMKTEFTQPAILTASVAVWTVLKEHGVTPDVVAGHSLGEYSALVAAGVMSFSDAVHTVHLRGKYMQEAVPLGEGGMAAIIALKPEIIEEIMNSGKWQTSVKEELSGRTTVVIRDQAYGSEATIEIYAKSIEIKTAWSKYSYRIFVANDIVWCEYNGAYRGLLEQVLLPTITPKESLLDSDVTESSLYGREHKKLREYAEDNLKLKQFRRENFNEQRNGTAAFDHPKRVYDEFIKEDYVVTPKDNK